MKAFVFRDSKRFEFHSRTGTVLFAFVCLPILPVYCVFIGFAF